MKVSSCLRYPGESLLYAISVIGMNSLQHHLQREARCSIIFKDLVGLLGPVDFSTSNTPAEAASPSQALCHCQESVAALQLRVKISLIRQYRGSRNPQSGLCNSVRGQRGERSAFLQIDLIKFADTVPLFGAGHGIDPIKGQN